MRANEPGTQAPWLPIYAALVSVALVVADRLAIAPALTWWHLPLVALAGAFVTILVTLMQESWRGGDDWLPVFAHRCLIWVAVGAWAPWADRTGWHTWTVLALLGGTAALSALGTVCQTPAALGRVPSVQQQPEESRRHPVIARWERIIRQVTRLPVVVTSWEPWDDPDDGLRLFAELPAELGTTTADLAAKAGNLAAAARLPRGCAVRVLDSDRQGVVVVDVMLRNCLVDATAVHVEPTTPASINQDFPVLTTPRGEMLSICLRIYSMIIGGTTGSGKTTLLHRIIMWLARCTDALVWVVDLNGGGLAEPWINPWANKRTPKPVVDWVADSEEEAAVMVAVARAIAVDRKTNREAARRKRAANETVLPVDAQMPAVVVLTDEGGEVRQAASLFGQLAGQGITRLAQIGRAEGLRVIMSVLRGTSDLTDKGLRVVTALRLCLRMEEHDEYAHVLGRNPGNTELEGAKGAGYLRTDTISRPVLGRTVNVDLAGIDRHAVACGKMRPDLDEYALRAAAKVTPAAVLGGREPAREHMAHPAMQDCKVGRAYTGRWDRYEAKLAQMRGEEYDDENDQAAPAALPAAPVQSTRTSALDAWSAAVEGPAAGVYSPPVPAPSAPTPGSSVGGARIIQFPRPTQQSAPTPAPAADTAREQILTLLRAAGADGLAASRIVEQVTATRSRVYDLLGKLVDEAAITKGGAGYVLIEYATSTAG